MKKTKNKKNKRNKILNRKVNKKIKKNDSIKFLTITLIVLLLVFISIITVVWYSYNKLLPEESTNKIEFTIKQPLFNSTQARTFLPAVDKEENGVLTLLVVEAVPGSGRTLVDIDSLLPWSYCLPPPIRNPGSLLSFSEPIPGTPWCSERNCN